MLQKERCAEQNRHMEMTNEDKRMMLEEKDEAQQRLVYCM
jgi:hypothetical protein